MRPQRLRHRIHFQRQQQNQNPYTGEVLLTWVTATLPEGKLLDSVPAEVLTGAGRELMAADAKWAETNARINLRWFPGLDAKWRILWDGKVYNITSIETDKTARRDYRLLCSDGVNDGR